MGRGPRRAPKDHVSCATSIVVSLNVNNINSLRTQKRRAQPRLVLHVANGARKHVSESEFGLWRSTYIQHSLWHLCTQLISLYTAHVVLNPQYKAHTMADRHSTKETVSVVVDNSQQVSATNSASTRRLHFETTECVETKTVTTTVVTKRTFPPVYVREPNHVDFHDPREYPLASTPLPPDLLEFSFTMPAIMSRIDRVNRERMRLRERAADASVTRSRPGSSGSVGSSSSNNASVSSGVVLGRRSTDIDAHKRCNAALTSQAEPN